MSCSQLQFHQLLLTNGGQNLLVALVVTNTLECGHGCLLNATVAVHVRGWLLELLNQKSVTGLVLILEGGKGHLLENLGQLSVANNLTIQVHVCHLGNGAHGRLSSLKTLLGESVITRQESLANINSLLQDLELTIRQVVGKDTKAVANSLSD